MYQIQVLVLKQLKAAWSYRWPAVLLTWVVCAGGWFHVMRMPNVYESSARLYVDSDAILTPLLRGLTVEPSLGAQLDLLARTLLSRPNLEKLISKTDLELQVNTPAERVALADSLAKEIRIAPQTNNLFLISYRNTSPKLAYDIVQATLTAFVEGKSGTNRSDLENASRFLETQINLYERQLRDAERRRAEFRTKFMEVLPGEGGAGGVAGANGALKNITGQLEDAQARRVTLAKELASTPPLLVTENEFIGGSRATRVREAEQKLMEMRLRLTDNHPDVIAQKDLISALKSGALGPEPGSESAGPVGQKGGKSVPNPVYEQMKVRLVETDTSIASLQRQLAETTKERDRLEAIAKGAPGLQAEQINLNRDYEVLSRNYNELLARREAMRMSAAADSNAQKVKMQVIDPPLVPQNPIPAKRTLLLTTVLFAGLGAGLGLAVLLVQLDQSFHTTDDLRNLGYPVVGGVSLLAASVPFVRKAVTIGTFAIAVVLPCLIYGGLVVQLARSGLA
jgi:polysaccharide chain length determinant protein (PEP-CTERM system associated)